MFCGSHEVCIKCFTDKNTFSADGNLSIFAATGAAASAPPVLPPTQDPWGPPRSGGWGTGVLPGRLALGAPGTGSRGRGHTPSAGSGSPPEL